METGTGLGLAGHLTKTPEMLRQNVFTVKYRGEGDKRATLFYIQINLF